MTDRTIQGYLKRYTEIETAYKELKEQMDAMDAAKRAIKAKIIEEYGEKSTQTVGRYVVKTWTTTTHAMDVKKVMAEEPELYEKYKKADVVSQYCSIKTEKV